jgi:hypothetical protein
MANRQMPNGNPPQGRHQGSSTENKPFEGIKKGKQKINPGFQTKRAVENISFSTALLALQTLTVVFLPLNLLYF